MLESMVAVVVACEGGGDGCGAGEMKSDCKFIMNYEFSFSSCLCLFFNTSI